MAGVRVSGSRREEALARRRDIEQDRINLWGDVHSYFKGWEVKANKHNDWTSNEYYNQLIESRKKLEEKEKHEMKLAERRDRLRALLTSEDEEYARQLSLLKLDGPHTAGGDSARLRELQVFTYQLKEKEEEARRREAELLIYQQWKARTPQIRDHERKQHTVFVREAWMNQVKEKHKEMEAKEQEEKKALKEMANKIKEEEQREKEMLETRKQRAVELQEQLMRQVKELREKDAEAEALKGQEAEDLRKEAQLEAIAQERAIAERKRKNMEHCWYLTHQWQLRLRRGVLAVQEELSADLRVLERLIAQDMIDHAHKSQLRNRARLEMLEAQATLKEQARREKEREENMHFLFQEEARKMWDQQQTRWNAEREARTKLMNDVLSSLQQQIREKLSNNIEKQKQLLRERELLLDDVEAANTELKAEQAALVQSKLDRKKDIDQQVHEKQVLAIDRLRMEEEEIRRRIDAEKMEEERILSEMKKMDIAGFMPKEAGRRKLFW